MSGKLNCDDRVAPLDDECDARSTGRINDSTRPHTVSIWVCRILLLLAFALYWGGLTCYTGFVVRISHDVLSDPMDGGLITQRVMAVLQMLGVVAVVLMVGNCVVVIRQSRKYGFLLVGCATIMAGSLIGMIVVHEQLDSIINLATAEITDRDAFVIRHRRYNQFTTVQWLSSLAYLPITVFAWRSMDVRVNLGRAHQD
jgi:hypothetical protein